MRSMMRCIITVSILLTLSLTLIQWAPDAKASNVDDSLVVGIQSTKTTVLRPLDPAERDLVSVYDLIYEGLFSIDDNYEPQPILCESWDMTGNGRTWTFHLRNGITFSDGTPLTAHDVVATAEYIINRATDQNSNQPGFYANLNYFINKISASDERTVVVRAPTKRSYYGVLYAMTFPVLPADRINTDNPPGTGPYVISSFSPGNYITLEANTLWWKNQPQVKHISFLLHDTPGAVIESYEYARVNTIFSRSIAVAQYKSGASSLSLDYRTNQLEVLLMNQSYSKLKFAAVRKAIRYAINIDAIAQNVYMGMVTRTNTPFIPGTWMYNDAVDSFYFYDPNRARVLLADDGWTMNENKGVLEKLAEDGTMLELTLPLYVYEEPDNDVRLETANAIKDQLAQVGINVQINTTTFADIQTKLKAGSFHLALVSYAMDPVPDYGFMLMGGNTGNYGRYRSSVMTDLCNKLRSCTNKNDYQNTLYKIQEQFQEDAPFLCLFYRRGTVLTRYMYTTVRDVREYHLLSGIESFRK